ncbi:MAG: hypothetical protein N2747_09675 [Chitinophagaceae bacterium]|nr:hypothetical protein [Chitinophagaceae bacterium]
MQPPMFRSFLFYQLQKIKAIRFVFFFLLFCMLTLSAPAQVFPFASKKARDSITLSLKQQIHQTLSLPFSPQSYRNWEVACWAMELMLYKPPKFEIKIPALLLQLPYHPAGLQRSFLEMLLTLYPRRFSKEVKLILPRLAHPKVKAMALEYLALNHIFPDLSADSSFLQSDYYLHYKNNRQNSSGSLIQLHELLDTGFLKGQTVLVSVQHPDRNIPGRLMIRTAQHQWHRDHKGRIFSRPQLARSLSNMPWYLTNGNTPQGLFRITGTDTSSSLWIGPTINLQIVMPFEQNTPVPFFEDTLNSLRRYEQLLGPLKKYPSLFQTYYAGRLGRNEIIAHGTAIPENFYLGRPYYPCTPSLGCLCSPETWDANGRLVRSSQKEWMDEVLRLQPFPQYLIVVEITEKTKTPPSYRQKR